MQLWKSVGFNMILLLAGLQNIPRHLYEAAAIDGAGGGTIFWRITLPLLSPTMFFALVITVINGFQVFDAPFILTQGGPGDASRTVVMYIYETGFRFFKMGYASTVALSLFLVILLLTGIQFRVSRTWVFYR
jgi:multiple sugar transport system permease protein